MGTVRIAANTRATTINEGIHRMPDFDVIVAGAGPAGSTAARLLAAGGASVLLVDRETFPRDKCCAGWLGALALKEFPEFAVKSEAFIESSFKGLLFYTPDLGQTAAYAENDPVGYQVKRAVFDAALVDMAREAGAKLLLGDGVAGVVESETEVAVATASGKKLTAKLVIGADGANSFVARAVGLMQEIEPKDLVVCVNENFEIGEDRVTEIFGAERPIHIALAYKFISGFGWVFPKKSSVTIGIGARNLTGEKARQRFTEFLSDVQAKGLLPKDAKSSASKGEAEPAGVVLKAKSLVSKRVILAGDAGGFVAAASGEGIYPGMLSAKIAAGCVAKALASADPAPALAEFDAAWRARLGKYLAMPNVNLAFMLPMIFIDKRVTAKFARGFLFGEKL